MIVPKVKPTDNIIKPDVLKEMYAKSMRTYIDTVNSVKSKTLDEIYTDEFKPSKLKSNLTTVKSLKTGKPEEVTLDSMLVLGNTNEERFRVKHYLITKKGSILGTKGFGFTLHTLIPSKYEGGFMQSLKNNEYAGTQIRLLQSTIETAKKNNANTLSLSSYIPAVIFHTMMGFRPIRTFGQEVKNVEDIQKALDVNRVDFKKAKFEENEVTPILSKLGKRYFFDRNRTLYCAAMKHNKKLLEQTNRRNLKISDNNCDDTISMEMKGREFNKWCERIKGHEMLPEGDFKPRKYNKWQLLYRLLFEVF